MQKAARLLQHLDPRLGFFLEQIDVGLGGIDLGAFQLDKIAHRSLWMEWQPAPASDSMIMDKYGRVRRIMEVSFCSLTDGLVIGAPAAQHPPILGYRVRVRVTSMSKYCLMMPLIRRSASTLVRYLSNTVRSTCRRDCESSATRCSIRA